MIEQAKLESFKREVVAHLENVKGVYDWLDAPGDIIQCPPSALHKGDFYVMGFNPGRRSAHHSHVDQYERTLSVTTRCLSATSYAPHSLQTWVRGWKNLNKLSAALNVQDWERHLFVANLFPDKSSGVSAWMRSHPQRPAVQYVNEIWEYTAFSLERSSLDLSSRTANALRGSTYRFLWDYLVAAPDGTANWGGTVMASIRDPSVKCFDLTDVDIGDGERLAKLTVIGIKHLRLPCQSRMDVLTAVIGERLTRTTI